MPLCSSSTLMGANVLALKTSFVFFACKHARTVEALGPQGCAPSAWLQTHTLPCVKAIHLNVPYQADTAP